MLFQTPPPIPPEVPMTIKDWLLVIGPLIGVLIGGLITSVAKIYELWYNRKRAEADAQVKRLTDIAAKLALISERTTVLFSALVYAKKNEPMHGPVRVIEDFARPVVDLANDLDAFFPALLNDLPNLLGIHSEVLGIENDRSSVMLQPLKDPARFEELEKQFNEASEKLHEKTIAMRGITNREIKRLLKISIT